MKTEQTGGKKTLVVKKIGMKLHLGDNFKKSKQIKLTFCVVNVRTFIPEYGNNNRVYKCVKPFNTVYKKR